MPHRRNNFTARTKRDAYERSKGTDGIARCECYRIPGWSGCGVVLVTGAIYYEHIEQDWIGGDNSLDNCAALTATCWRRKTDTQDLPVIAKVKRVRDLAIGVKRRSSRPMPGGRDSQIRIKMNGSVVDRRTGLPWRGR